MVTINDVAARAGVGAGTVSRVLNNSPKVSAPTRARVLDAMAALDYRPNPLAQGLSRGRCRTLGVLVPFFTQASAIERLRGVVSALAGSDYDLVLFNVESPAHAAEHLAALSRQRADGLLVMSLPLTGAQLATLAARGVAVVLVDVRGAGIPAVVTDDVEGGRMATRHLVALGHERIGFLGDSPDNPFGFTSSASRERGYLDTLAAAGLGAPAELRRYGPHDRAVAASLTAQLLALPEPPTAIFACSDVQAMGAIEAVRATGRDVPGDVSIVGFDDIELAPYAGLTTVRQPLFESGARGAGLLLDRLSGATSAAGVTTLPLQLVERTTTAPVTLDPSGAGARSPRSETSRVTAARGTRTPRDEGHGRDRP